jgi:UDP-glucose 4-epimerase
LLEVLGRSDHEVREIGTRHGEKLFEALLSREEFASAEDLGDYYRVPPDGRDLNYAKYFEQGERRISLSTDYNSHNTRQLDVPEMRELLTKLPFIQRVLRGEAASVEY